MILLRILCAIFIFIWPSVTGQRNYLRVANTYNDEMVLQQEPKKSKIWGFGTERFSEISLTVNSKTFYTSVQSDLRWFIELSPQPSGGPHKISITQTSISGNSPQTIYLTNVLFGDVWLCMGEANMDFNMKNIENSQENINETLLYADRIKLGRTYTSDNPVYSSVEIEEVPVFWRPLNQIGPYGELNLNYFSATCLLYGVQLAKLLQDKRPIGLLLTTYNNTPIEHWSSERVTTTCHTPVSTAFDKQTYNGLWNALVYPLTKTSVRGVIWSQGESNIGHNNDLYNCHLKELINDYKNSFYDATTMADYKRDFPFGIVQLGTMNSGQNENWSKIRWAQTLGTGYLPNTMYPNFFMATSYDIVDKDSPFGSVLTRNKKATAIRLANAAAALVYNVTSQQWLHPPFATNAIRGASGFVGLTFSTNVTIIGTEGFLYCRLITGTEEDCKCRESWSPVLNFLQISGNKVGVAVPEDARYLAYAWGATVCELNNCALYSADKYFRLPVQPWCWPIAAGDNEHESINKVDLL